MSHDPGMSAPVKNRRLKRQCTAHKSDGSGKRCRLSAVRGSNVCHKHGAGAPQVKRSARERLDALVEPAITALAAALERVDANPLIALHPSIGKAALAVLDRCGYPRATTLEIHERDREISEAQAQTIARVIDGVLTELGVADLPNVAEVVRKHLKAAATGGPPPAPSSTAADPDVWEIEG